MKTTRREKLFPDRLPLKLTVEDDPTTLELLLERPWVDDTVRESLTRATMVFVQWEEFRGIDQPVFPTHTAELFRYMSEHAPPEIHSEVAVRNEDYSEVSLHADLVWLPALLVSAGTLVVVPTVVNLISEWLKLRLFKRYESADAKFELHILDASGTPKLLRYEGPASELWRVTEMATKLAQPTTLPVIDSPETPHPVVKHPKRKRKK
jgi:hypothetical protein